MIDLSKRAVIPLFPLDNSVPAMSLIVYGRSAAELMTVPNEVVHTLAKRYPGYISSPFMVYDLKRVVK